MKVLEELYVEMKSSLLRDQAFYIIVDDWITATFSRCGETAGYMRLSQGERGASESIHAFAVFPLMLFAVPESKFSPI